jgi:cephalosporin-C deacetylase-like acetyl esterase
MNRLALFVIASTLTSTSLYAQSLPGTKPLESKEDLAAVMVEGIDRYLDRQLAASVAGRKQFWQPDYSSAEAYVKSVGPNRERLKKILGLVDQRLPVPALDFMASTVQPLVVAETKAYKIYAVRWPVLPGVEGEGLLLEPKTKAQGCVVAIPDADWTPEMLAGIAPGIPLQAQFARMLAENGCRVVVPTLIDRQDTWSGNPMIGGNPRIARWTNQTHREFIYRMSYEMGRHIIGYEMQRILAVVDWFSQTKDHPPIGVYGCGEGGLLALYCGAVDTRIDVTGVSSYFGPREKLYDEPIYRNVWSLLREFGDAELLALILPRALVVEQADLKVAPAPAARSGRAGAAPGTLTSPTLAQSAKEILRGLAGVPKDFPLRKVRLRPPPGKDTRAAGDRGPGSTGALPAFFNDLTGHKGVRPSNIETQDLRKNFNPLHRQKRQFDQLVGFTQKLLPLSAARRQEHVWDRLDTSSQQKYEKSTQPLRDNFWEEIIGKLPEATVSMNPRTRLIYETPKWKGYEVTLDLYEDVICYGILLIPNDIAPGEKRPVVVCQHGLEGRPTDVVDPKKKTVYNAFGAQLADRGFIVFAPQNPYIFHNKFRQLVRKANPLKLSLYSFIVAQHERIIDWLSTLPFVDSARIAFYGLSYGGKVAMRIPSILLRYCLSICSGDFNEWIWKNITLDWQNSYMFTVEYDMYEFNLGNTFNYAEMAALIAPRPFMVERGHDDGVGLDEYVAFEYAKVRRLYSRLRLSDRTAIEFFPGGHEIHGVGTFAFLHRHLNWPAPK